VTAILLTAKGFERLTEELGRLRTEREALVERVRTEEPDSFDARHELDLLDRRLVVLEKRLLDSQVVESRRDGEVDVGERVTVLDLESGRTADYRIVGSGESDPAALEVSYLSPIGSALLGRRVGDVVEVDAPRGRRRLEIVEVDG
jgi:transcription elongation factor GreA